MNESATGSNAMRDGARPPRFDYASLVLVALWIGLWALWPRSPRATDRPPPTIARAAVSYAPVVEMTRFLVREPMLFMQSTRTAFPDMEEDVTSVYYALTREKAQDINLAVTEAFHPSPPAPPGLEGRVQPAVTRYDPRWRHEPVFANTGTSPRELVILVRDGLDACEFSVDTPEYDAKTFGDQPWQVTLSLRCDSEGVPLDVFVVESSRDPVLDQWLVRVCSRGRAAASESGCRGNLTVFWGER